MSQEQYSRKVTSTERMLSYAPFAVVTMVARIKGHVTLDQLSKAISKAQERHINLRVRIEHDSENNLWFTTQRVKEIPITQIEREDKDHWLKVHLAESKKPFEFDTRPAVRFYLVHSPEISEIIILCHHIICDGLSLAYLTRDLMYHLGFPEHEAKVLTPPTPIDQDNTPKYTGVNPIAKLFINRINRKWRKDPVAFDIEDYRSINKAYWSQADHRALSLEFSELDTDELVKACRGENVTVNSALTAAFAGAQQIVQGHRQALSKIGIAASLRERIPKPALESMGFYAGVVNIDFSYDDKRSFWDNARKVHREIQPLLENKHLFKDINTWNLMDSDLLESINFKRLGGLVSSDSPRYEKLSNFAERDDVVSSILQREKMDSLDRIVLGSAITNLTRMAFTNKYGRLTLDRLIMNPGGAFPLSNINLVLGAVTCSGKLSLLLEYDEDTVDTDTVFRVKEKAMNLLQGKHKTGDAGECARVSI